MDTILEILPDITEGGGFYLTAVGITLWIFICVTIIKKVAFKPAHKELYWYDGAIMGIGALVGLPAVFLAFIANGIAFTVPNVALAVLGGVLYGATAAGGYQWLKAGREFVAGRFEGRQPPVVAETAEGVQGD